MRSNVHFHCVCVLAPGALMERSGVLHPWLQLIQLLTSALAARGEAGTLRSADF